MQNTQILSTGSYLPEKIVTNDNLANLVDTSHKWIIERTGIAQRHIVADDETTCSMAFEASKRALLKADLDAKHIDLIIVATCTPDRHFPSTACLLQDKLGITQPIIAFDVSAACSGFIYALNIADQFIQNHTIKTALVVGSEVMSRALDWQDRRTCILFGDGAGAAVLQATERPGIIASHLFAQGQYKDILYYPNDEAAPALKEETPFLKMSGKEVFRFSIGAANHALESCKKMLDVEHLNLDWVVPHQANIRIVNAIANKLHLPLEKIIVTLDKHGNTSSASIPIALDHGIESGKIRRDNKLFLLGFGGGMTWGYSYIQF